MPSSEFRILGRYCGEGHRQAGDAATEMYLLSPSSRLEGFVYLGAEGLDKRCITAGMMSS